MRSIENLATTYKPDSEVSQLSVLEPDTPRVLSPEIFTVLERSLHYYQLTDGAFDITVGPLMKLWRDAVKRDTPPTSEEIATVLQSVGSDKITLDAIARTIAFGRPGMSITLDAIVKGYAADQALSVTRKDTAIAGLVDIGGDIVCFGHPPDRQGWNIGIQNPFQPATGPMDTSPGSILATIRLTNAAVATSGNYQRTFQIQGKSYSQIIDSRTGLPVKYIPSVTIIAPTAADADALATACSVLRVPQALDLINSIPRTEALLIAGSAESPTFHTSTGFENYLLTPLVPPPASLPD
jgi:thiamine biosynthesis lipoprotein